MIRTFYRERKLDTETSVAFVEETKQRAKEVFAKAIYVKKEVWENLAQPTLMTLDVRFNSEY